MFLTKKLLKHSKLTILEQFTIHSWITGSQSLVMYKNIFSVTRNQMRSVKQSRKKNQIQNMKICAAQKYIYGFVARPSPLRCDAVATTPLQ